MAIPPGQTSLILASASPRRRALLEGLGLVLEVEPASIDEEPRPNEQAAPYVERLAFEKAQAIAGRRPGRRVLGADTTVVLDEEIIGKPADAKQAKAILSRLSGKTHVVITAVCLAGPRGPLSCRVETLVTFRPLRSSEIDWYASTAEPLDKAGGYAIQGIAGSFVLRIDGSHSNVVGLPLAQTVQLLESAGHPMPWSDR